MEKQISIKGLNRAVPLSEAPDGACQEIINLRYRNGAWRPIPPKSNIGSSVFEELSVLLGRTIGVITFDQIFLHDIEQGINPGNPNWIGYKFNSTSGHGELYVIDRSDPANPTASLLNNSLDASISVTVTFLKRFMLVATGSGLVYYLWDVVSTSYILIILPGAPEVDLHKDNIAVVREANMGKSTTAAMLLANYWTIINNLSQNTGQLYGSIMYISVYKLFDGTYILPSIPRYFEISNDGVFTDINGQTYFNFTLAGLKASVDASLYPINIALYQELISSVCIFATQCVPLHKIDQTTLTDPINTSKFVYSMQDFYKYFPINPTFQSLAESELFYIIHEFDFSNLVAKGGRIFEAVDTINFYQNYAAHEVLPADSFSHHTVVSNVINVYNDRLHIGAVKTIYGSPYVQWPLFRSDADMGNETTPGTVMVWIKTSLGQSVISYPIDVPIFNSAITTTEVIGPLTDLTAIARGQARADYLNANPAAILNFVPGSAYTYQGVSPLGYAPIYPINTTYNSYLGPDTAQVFVTYRTLSGTGRPIILPGLVGYNDYRATRMQISTPKYGYFPQQLIIFDQSLKSNISLNYAYYINRVWSPNNESLVGNFNDVIEDSSYTPAVIPYLANTQDTPQDPNLVKVSEVQNPLVFLAVNTYQVGTGTILAMAAGTEPLSIGQFGQFPLQVFTSKGVWALQIGTGSILYTNVIPVSGEVADNPKNILSLMGGVLFSSVRGLFMIFGSKSEPVSTILEGEVHNLSASAEITTLITDSRFTSGLNLSDENFLAYLLNSAVGFDQINKELIVSNPAKPYSYIFSFESKLWFTVSKTYDLLINAWPNLYGLSNADSIIYDLSTESLPNSMDMVKTMIITSAQSLDDPDGYKKINRAILRIAATTGSGTYAGFYIFASNDLNTWSLLTGMQRTGTRLKDLLNQRSHGSAKYYLFVFNGTITTNSEVKSIDIDYVAKWNKRLR